MTLIKPKALCRILITDIETRKNKTITIYPNEVKSTTEVIAKIIEVLE